MSDVSSLPAHFRDLKNQSPRDIVDYLLRTNPTPLGHAINTALSALSHFELRSLIQRLIDTIRDRVFKDQLFRAIEAHIREHPIQTVFLVTGVVIGVILMCNPLAIIGFGSLGPVAGSIAAGWQASIGGSVAAGSVFATLQSLGMLGAVAIPVAGAAIAGTTVVTVVAAQDQGAKAAAAEVGTRGECGEPVKAWWSGEYGQPVRNWWGGTETTVKNWWEQVAKGKN